MTISLYFFKFEKKTKSFLLRLPSFNKMVRRAKGDMVREGIVMGRNASPNSKVEVLTLTTRKCDFLGGDGLYRGNQVNMRSLEWVIIEYNWCLISRGDLDAVTHIEDNLKTHRGQDGYLQAKEEAWNRSFPHSS